MTMIRLKNITKRFGKTVAVKKMNLAITQGEFVVFVGPSGCGKTTTLRCIAGLEAPDEGEIYINEELVNDIPTLDRDVGFVFQHYALFPHITAYANIAFPLRAMRQNKSVIEKEVHKIAEMLQIQEALYLKPSQLSSGDLQRIALARALVIKPKVFLLDEPLSTLDAEFREEVRTLIKKIHYEFGSTTIYVTHDQYEAMSLADRMVVMNFGEINQYDIPEKVYQKPKNMFIANFIGSPGMNFIECFLEKDAVKVGQDHKSLAVDAGIIKRLRGALKGNRFILGIRPEDILLSSDKNELGLKMKVSMVEELGAVNIINLQSEEFAIKVLTGPEVIPKHNSELWAIPNQENIHVFDKETGREILF
jgi:multiple sugar transport system ATP-binding protein